MQSSRIVENGSSCNLLERFALNLFLIELSVLPVSSLEISHHRLPWMRYSLTILISSSIVHFVLRTFGSN